MLRYELIADHMLVSFSVNEESIITSRFTSLLLNSTLTNNTASHVTNVIPRAVQMQHSKTEMNICVDCLLFYYFTFTVNC